MPIRPELRHFYRGPAWRATRERILTRAGNKCERCHAPNHVVVLRVFGWWTPSSLDATVSYVGGRIAGRLFIQLPWKAAGLEGQPVIETSACFPSVAALGRWVYIVLTIAHLNQVSGDDRDENLLALCQWCHLNHDVRFHHANARRTRAERTGQTWLTPELEARPGVPE